MAALLIVPAVALGQDLNPPPATDEGSSPPPEQDATERARAAFARGLACVEEHETACAERAFREALSLRDSAAIRYNLASALFDLSRYPEAARLTASVLADESTSEDVRNSAQMLQQQLESQAATLVIHTEGDDEGVTVQVDGEAVPDAQLASVLVAPGARVVTATRGDHEVAREEVQAESTVTTQVTLTVVPPPEEVAALAPIPEPTPAEPPIYEDWRFWAVVGGAAAVVVAAVVIAVVVVATAGVEAPIEGNYDPGILRWE